MRHKPIGAIALGVALLVSAAPAALATEDKPRKERADGADTGDEFAKQRITHNGKQKDFSATGWGTAVACNEVKAATPAEPAEYKCYDSYEEADRAAVDASSPAAGKASATRASKQRARAAGVMWNTGSTQYTCAPTWVCLFEHSSYGGRKVQWTDPGTKELGGTLAFRDQASSMVNNKDAGVTLTDFRTGMPDHTIFFCTTCSSYVPYLSAWSHPQGNWNDKADRVYIG